jgi:5-methylthioadenosine/S-adenosylhomocysteine deaminase
MTLFRGYADDLELMDWLKNKIWPAEEKLTGEDIYYGSFLACIEMIKSGTTTFNDMYGFIEDTIKAIDETGIRATLGRAILDIKDEKDIRIQEVIQLIEKYTSDKIEGRVTFNIAPHSPYICNESSLKLCLELAKKYNIPIHIHLSETKDELDIIKEKYNMTPVEFLKANGVFEVPVILAHSVWVTDKDIEILKNISGGIAHNPISNCKLASRDCSNYKIFRK